MNVELQSLAWPRDCLVAVNVLDPPKSESRAVRAS
jgi:hypothetical protein